VLAQDEQHQLIEQLTTEFMNHLAKLTNKPVGRVIADRISGKLTVTVTVATFEEVTL
jgi:hypothetical protein